LVGAQNIMRGLFGRGAVIASLEATSIQTPNAGILTTGRSV
jgi:hypothetical protein